VRTSPGSPYTESPEVIKPKLCVNFIDRDVVGDLIIAVPEKQSCWTKIHVVGDLTVQQVIDKLKADLGLASITKLTCGRVVFYNRACSGEEAVKTQNKRLGMELIAVYEEVINSG
jgi:hypothetical protein